MKRKSENENTSGSGSHSANHEKQDECFILRRPGEKHNDALAILEKRFGSDDFSTYAANRVGVNSLILKDLVRFGLVRYLDGCYDLHVQIENLNSVYEVPIRCFYVGGDMMKKYQTDSFDFYIESKTYNESVRLFFARPNSKSKVFIFCSPLAFEISPPISASSSTPISA